MKAKYILPILLIMVLLAGCNDDFLDHKPIAKGTEVSYYENFNALDQTATAAYGMLCSRDIFDIFYTIAFGSAASDDAETGGENTNDWPEIQSIDRMAHSPQDNRVLVLYDYCFKGIRMCNEYLTRIDDIKENEPNLENPTPVETIDQRTAEMKFLRAFYYYTLTQVFGGVPIVEDLLGPADNDMPRNTLKEVYTFIENDLLEAIPDLPERSEIIGGPDQARATVGAAKALLAKMYLYESSYAKNYAGDSRFEGCTERYDDALDYAEQVIESGEYYLLGGENDTETRFASWRDTSADESGIGGYRYLFTLDADLSAEGVWEINNVRDQAGWVLSRGNYITVYTTIRFYYDADSTENSLGWSFNLPTKYMIDAFGNQDSRETGLNSEPMDPDMDPRFRTTVGLPGDLIYAEGEWLPMSFSNLPTNSISRKYECSPDEYWDTRNDWHDGPMNLRLIRFADVLLMAAEAAYELDQQDKALDYVNRVRTRARMSGNTGFPEDLTEISFEDIVHERRLELAMEGHRFFDLVRWGLADDFISGTTLDALGGGFVVEFVEGKHEFYPLPVDEMQINGALEQYEGWRQ